MFPRTLAVALAASLALAGCQTATKQQSGAVIGGIAGGILGSQIGSGSGRTAAIIGGTLLGAVVGGAIGADMDQNDRYQAQVALENTADYSPTSWRNPNTGYTYTVTPTRTYETRYGYCREYDTEVYMDGRRQYVRGTACREPDGTWRAI